MEPCSKISATDGICYIEQLPKDIIGKIVAQLPKVTGRAGFLNEADIPVMMRYMSNLGLTSKRLLACVHDRHNTSRFFYALAEKHGKTPLYFAAKLNTVAARIFIWHQIEEQGYDEVYRVIQDVYALASSLLVEAEEAGLCFKYSEGRETHPSPNGFHGQTKTGFGLSIDGSPNRMVTPLGEITIYNGGMSQGCSTYSVSEVFIKRLDATFERVTGCMFGEQEGRLYEYAGPPSDSDRIRELKWEDFRAINEEELGNKKGSQNLITHTLCGRCSVYQMRQVAGRKLPPITYHTTKNSRLSYEETKIIWEMLKKERRGKDPIEKEEVEQRPPPQKSDPLFNNIGELPAWAAQIVQELFDQPFFEGRGLFDSLSKVLTMDNYQKANAISILYSGSETMLDEDLPYISTFGIGNHRLYLNKKDIGCGLELHLDDELVQSNSPNLKKAFETLISELSRNWKEATLPEYPDMIHKESEEEYALFIKKNPDFKQEDVLIRIIADLLGIHKFIHCGNSSAANNDSYLIYLWIRKDKLEKVKESLGLEFIS